MLSRLRATRAPFSCLREQYGNNGGLEKILIDHAFDYDVPAMVNIGSTGASASCSSQQMADNRPNCDDAGIARKTRSLRTAHGADACTPHTLAPHKRNPLSTRSAYREGDLHCNLQTSAPAGEVNRPGTPTAERTSSWAPSKETDPRACSRAPGPASGINAPSDISRRVAPGFGSCYEQGKASLASGQWQQWFRQGVFGIRVCFSTGRTQDRADWLGGREAHPAAPAP